MGGNAAVKTWKIMKNLERILAIEFYNAAQAMEFRRPARTSPFLENILAEYRKVVGFIENDEVMYLDINDTVGFLGRLRLQKK